MNIECLIGLDKVKKRSSLNNSLHTLIVEMYSCFYSTLQVLGTILASVEVSLILLEKNRDRYAAVFVELVPQLKIVFLHLKIT